MYCGKCGFKLTEGTVYCPKCGTKVEATGYSYSYAEETPEQKNKFLSKKAVPFYVLIGIAIVAIAAVALFLLTRSKSSSMNLDENGIYRGFEWGSEYASVEAALNADPEGEITESFENIGIYDDDITNYWGIKGLDASVIYGFSGDEGLNLILITMELGDSLDFDTTMNTVMEQLDDLYGDQGKDTLGSIVGWGTEDTYIMFTPSEDDNQFTIMLNAR